MAKILVVDDRPDVCQTIEQTLERRGHSVHTAQTVRDGVEALKRSVHDREPYEVAIIDLVFENYAGSDEEKRRAGMQVLSEAVKVPFLEPIMVTAFPSADTAAAAIPQGVFRYIEKEKGNSTGFMDAVVDAVELAIDNREVFRTLDESLTQLRSSLEELKRSNQSLIGAAMNYVKFAENAYHVVLKTRGRHP